MSSYNGLAELEKWLGAKNKTAPKRAHNSTLAAPTKAPAKVGAKAKREAPAKKQCRAEVFARDLECVVCDRFGKPEKITRFGDDEWAHVHGRRTERGADKVVHPAYSVRLCKTHHDWHHGKASHTLGIDVRPHYNGFKQTFTVDGALSESRIVRAVKEEL